MQRQTAFLAGTVRAVLLGSVALGLAAPAFAEESAEAELNQLLQEMREMRAKQEQLEQQSEEQRRALARAEEERQAVPDNVVTGGDQPGSFRLPGTNTSVRIGGYVKGDLIYDVDASLGDTFDVGSIPPQGSPQRSGSFRAHGKESRLNITTWTPTGFGELRTVLEGDFFGAGGNQVFSNSTTFRLRHAFGELGTPWGGRLLAGQTWTNFMSLASYPDTVDFFGPQGMPFIRQGQLRYTQPLTDGLELSFSAENSEFTGRDYQGRTVGSASSGDVRFGIDKIPDFTATLNYSDDLVDARLSGVVRRLGLQGGGSSTSKLGWGAHASAAVRIGEFIPALGGDSVQANFTYGDGIGRYLINGFAQDAFVTSSRNLRTIRSYGVALGYTRQWTDQLRSNLVWGQQGFLDTFGPADTRRTDSIHANLIWSPVDSVDLGLEFMYGRRTFQRNSLSKGARRIQFGARYSF
jgi:outer membrane murein-binding lipoprotein Lpp